MPPSRRPGASSAALPINNPSYAQNPTLWHSIALQQQRLAEMKVDLGARPVRASGRLAPSRGVLATPVSRPQPSSSRNEYDDDDDDDDNYKQPTLTLAQRMGLAEAPEPELTPSECKRPTVTQFHKTTVAFPLPHRVLKTPKEFKTTFKASRPNTYY